MLNLIDFFFTVSAWHFFVKSCAISFIICHCVWLKFFTISFFILQVEFIRALSEILAHGANSPVARMAAGLQLKNCLTSKDLELKLEYQQRWLTFPPDLRSYIKKNILAALGTETIRPSSAAQCVAYVAVAELPVSQWPELISVLVANVTAANSTEMVREATLETIGYICQDIVNSFLVLYFIGIVFLQVY